MIQIEFKISTGDSDIVSDLLFEESALSVTTNDSYENQTMQVIFKDIESYKKILSKNIIPANHTVNEIKDSDWKNKWLEDYKGAEINDKIFVKPFNLPLPEGKNYQIVIEINPNDAFGDGLHPTTRMCMELLYETASGSVGNKSDHNLLDVGTGTGILAILAGKLGIKQISLFDYDKDSVSRTEENLLLNGLSGISPFQGDLYTFNTNEKFSLITANILSVLIIENITRMKEWLAGEGVMILSGVNTVNSVEVEDCFAENGLTVLKKLTDGEWCAYLLTR